MDTSKSVGLTDAPQPGSVSQAVFVSELYDRECAVLDHTRRTTVTEQKSSISSLVRDRQRADSKNNNPRRPTVVMTSCMTLIVPNWNRIAVILDRVFMVMASYRTANGPSRKIITLDRSTTVVMASCLTSLVPSWNRIAVILHSVVTVMASCLTVSVPRRKIITLDRITVVMASCLTLFVPS